MEFLGRIDRVDGKIGAFVTVDREGRCPAPAQLTEREERVSSLRLANRLVKDNMCTRGIERVLVKDIAASSALRRACRRRVSAPACSSWQDQSGQGFAMGSLKTLRCSSPKSVEFGAGSGRIQWRLGCSSRSFRGSGSTRI